ncbi:MAG TPA: AMP-binding protein [Pantanalinema sp.]
MASGAAAFIKARDFLRDSRTDYERAYRDFAWPSLTQFNWALDYFDVYARDNARPALIVVSDDGNVEKLSYAAIAARSSRVANWLRQQGVRRGDRILLMLPNIVPLWEIMLAAIKLGAVLIPATTLLAPEDLEDRFERGGVKHVLTDPTGAAKFEGLSFAFTRIVVGGSVAGWRSYAEADGALEAFEADGPTAVDDPLLIYFTSGTTAKPKLVTHTHQSYPVGHLATMYWIGLQEGDVHYNISSPGWAKHAWSNFFAPWNAGATVFVFNYQRFDAKRTLEQMVEHGVTTLCAPPTVWRMLMLEDLSAYPLKLREIVGAGEPLNPEVIRQVKEAWGITIRDGYGQTETTAQIGNTPGQPIRPGSMGRPLPGYRVALIDADGQEWHEGELSLRLEPAPVGLMKGYLDDPEKSERLLGGAFYPTGDVASRDSEGYYWYVGRADDVFKSADYRISPFELESVLIEHEAVLEAAVIPSPDPLRLSVPKAIVALKPGQVPSAELAQEILAFARANLAAYKRIRRLEFGELPKTISGKIRRVQLRKDELEQRRADARGAHEYWEEDFAGG